MSDLQTLRSSIASWTLSQDDSLFKEIDSSSQKQILSFETIMTGFKEMDLKCIQQATQIKNAFARLMRLQDNKFTENRIAPQTPAVREDKKKAVQENELESVVVQRYQKAIKNSLELLAIPAQGNKNNPDDNEDNKSVSSANSSNPNVISKDIRLPAIFGTDNFTKTEYLGIAEERPDRTETIASRAQSKFNGPIDQSQFEQQQRQPSQMSTLQQNPNQSIPVQVQNQTQPPQLNQQQPQQKPVGPPTLPQNIPQQQPIQQNQQQQQPKQQPPPPANNSKPVPAVSTKSAPPPPPPPLNLPPPLAPKAVAPAAPKQSVSKPAPTVPKPTQTITPSSTQSNYQQPNANPTVMPQLGPQSQPNEATQAQDSAAPAPTRDFRQELAEKLRGGMKPQIPQQQQQQIQNEQQSDQPQPFIPAQQIPQRNLNENKTIPTQLQAQQQPVQQQPVNPASTASIKQQPRQTLVSSDQLPPYLRGNHAPSLFDDEDDQNPLFKSEKNKREEFDDRLKKDPSEQLRAIDDMANKTKQTTTTLNQAQPVKVQNDEPIHRPRVSITKPQSSLFDTEEEGTLFKNQDIAKKYAEEQREKEYKKQEEQKRLEEMKRQEEQRKLEELKKQEELRRQEQIKIQKQKEDEEKQLKFRQEQLKKDEEAKQALLKSKKPTNLFDSDDDIPKPISTTQTKPQITNKPVTKMFDDSDNQSKPLQSKQQEENSHANNMVKQINLLKNKKKKNSSDQSSSSDGNIQFKQAPKPVVTTVVTPVAIVQQPPIQQKKEELHVEKVNKVRDFQFSKEPQERTSLTNKPVIEVSEETKNERLALKEKLKGMNMGMFSKPGEGAVFDKGTIDRLSNKPVPVQEEPKDEETINKEIAERPVQKKRQARGRKADFEDDLPPEPKHHEQHQISTDQFKTTKETPKEVLALPQFNTVTESRPTSSAFNELKPPQQAEGRPTSGIKLPDLSFDPLQTKKKNPLGSKQDLQPEKQEKKKRGLFDDEEIVLPPQQKKPVVEDKPVLRSNFEEKPIKPQERAQKLNMLFNDSDEDQNRQSKPIQAAPKVEVVVPVARAIPSAQAQQRNARLNKALFDDSD